MFISQGRKSQSSSGAGVGDLPAHARRCKRRGRLPWVGKVPWRREAAHCSVLAWRAPRTEGPGGLQSTGPLKGWTRLSTAPHSSRGSSRRFRGVSSRRVWSRTQGLSASSFRPLQCWFFLRFQQSGWSSSRPRVQTEKFQA